MQIFNVVINIQVQTLRLVINRLGKGACETSSYWKKQWDKEIMLYHMIL